MSVSTRWAHRSPALTIADTSLTEVPKEVVADFESWGIRAFTTTRDAGTFSLSGTDPVNEVMGRWTSLQRELSATARRVATIRQVHGTRVLVHTGGWEGWLRYRPPVGHRRAAPFGMAGYGGPHHHRSNRCAGPLRLAARRAGHSSRTGDLRPLLRGQRGCSGAANRAAGDPTRPRRSSLADRRARRRDRGPEDHGQRILHEVRQRSVFLSPCWR